MSTNFELKYEEIKKQLSKITKSVLHLFDFVCTNEEITNWLIDSAIEATTNEYKINSGISIEVLYKKNLTKEISNYIKKEIKENKNLQIIVNYIKKELKVAEDYLLCIKNLEKLFSFFELIELSLTEEEYIELIKRSEILRTILEVIVDKNILSIQKNNYNIAGNDKINNLIELYTNTNIEQQEENLENKDYDEIESELEDISEEEKNAIEEYGKILTRQQEYDLFTRYRQGEEELLDFIVEKNLGLVNAIANKYQGRGLEFEDLFQEGTFGLIKAARNFNPDRGCKFSTYATWWIKQTISRGISDTGRNIRFPVHVNESYSKLERAKERLIHSGKEPTTEELSGYTGLSESTIKSLERLPQTISINTKVGKDEDAELGEFIPNEDIDVETMAENNYLKEDMLKILKKAGLTPREERIIRLRFGIDDGKDRTLEEVGKIIGVTRERIRQIEAKSLRKLRNTSRRTGLASYNTNNRNNTPKEELSPTKKSPSLTIFEHLNPYTQDQIIEGINKLNSKDIQYLKTFFGEDYSKKVSKSTLDITNVNKIFFEIFPRIRRAIKGENPYLRKVQVKTIYQVLNEYTKEEIDKAIKYLSDEGLRLLRLKYGEDLENPISSPNMTKEEKEKFFIKTIRRLKVVLKKLRENPDKTTIYEILKEFLPEDIDNEINKLSKEEKEIIRKTFKEDLNIPCEIDIYDKNISKTITKLRKRLVALRKKRESEKAMPSFSIFQYFDFYRKDRILLSIDNLNEEDKEYLKSIFGEDYTGKTKKSNLSEKQQKRLFKSIFPKIRRYASGYKREGTTYNRSIYALLSEYTKEEINIAIKKLGEDDIALIKLKYGEDLEKPNQSPSMTEEEKQLFYSRVVRKLKKILKRNREESQNSFDQNKTIFEYFRECSEHQVILAISLLDLKSKILIYSKFGYELKSILRNYTKEEIDEFKGKILPQIERIIKSTVCKQDTSEELRTNHIIESLSKQITFKELDVLLLKLKNIQTVQIAKALNLAEKEVIEIAAKTIKMYKEAIESQKHLLETSDYDALVQTLKQC